MWRIKIASFLGRAIRPYEVQYRTEGSRSTNVERFATLRGAKALEASLRQQQEGRWQVRIVKTGSASSLRG